jgi:6-pyruvoyltetrahydropterin/6-carboxytetrahydropterin synthase
MNIAVAKTFEISTGHRLSDYSGKCKNLHGHNYIGEVTIKGQESDLNKLGMLMDFGDLKKAIQDSIDKRFDHKIILKKGDPFNEALGEVCKKFGDESIVWVDYNPTVENIIQDMHETLRSVFYNANVSYDLHLKVFETSTSYAEI